MDKIHSLLNQFKTNIKINPYPYLAILICIVWLLISFVFSAPFSNKQKVIHVAYNDSLNKISLNLKDQRVIRSRFTFKVLVTVFSGDRSIPRGDYLFKKNENIFSVSWQVARGIHKVQPIRVTLKEGMTNEQMASVLADKIPGFRKDLFLGDNKAKQGYLFPDTYFLYPLSETSEILSDLTSNFNKKISKLENDVKNSDHSLDDIIKMASIIQKEAHGKDDAYIISGILWKRINMGLALQVDAAPKTYENAGLPDEPICNPGFIAIDAALHPEKSPYLFYLHDDSGQVHYAVDFSEHRSNIAHYLK